MVGWIVTHRGGIPARRNKTEWFGLARPSDVENGEVAGVGVGDEQHAAVRRQRQAVGRIAGRRVGVEGAAERLQRLAPMRNVQHAHLGRIGTGHEKRLAVRTKSHFRRMSLRPPNGDNLCLRRVDDGNAGFAPQTDV